MAICIQYLEIIMLLFSHVGMLFLIILTYLVLSLASAGVHASFLCSLYFLTGQRRLLLSSKIEKGH